MNSTEFIFLSMFVNGGCCGGALERAVKAAWRFVQVDVVSSDCCCVDGLMWLRRGGFRGRGDFCIRVPEFKSVISFSLGVTVGDFASAV